MKMAWWIFMSLITVQIILTQFMVEEFLAGYYHNLTYYVWSLGFMFALTIITFLFFKKADKVLDQ
ncbi:hypothetical protein WAK64_04430 [Bacillus spongiae]|uniref:Uncharacterized protein n=1 Tax=Bacillus spongiae TaxID=2683610 RepID=A0ABU8HAT2_9BACI